MSNTMGQSILMALAVTVNKYASSNIQSVHRNQPKTSPAAAADGRRGLLLFAATAAATAPQVIDSKSELLKKYLKKSEENKEKNDKERLESYYRRIYKDYFEFIEGSVKNKKELSQSEKDIIEWLRNNK